MKSINMVTLVGRTGRDAEVRHNSSGTKTVTISLATNRPVKNRETDEWDDNTTWHYITAWGRAADTIEQCKKGDALHVQGRIDVRKWTDKEGTDRYAHQIIADSANRIMLERKKESNTGQRSANSTVGNTPRSAFQQPASITDDDDFCPF